MTHGNPPLPLLRMLRGSNNARATRVPYDHQEDAKTQTHTRRGRAAMPTRSTVAPITRPDTAPRPSRGNISPPAQRPLNTLCGVAPTAQSAGPARPPRTCPPTYQTSRCMPPNADALMSHDGCCSLPPRGQRNTRAFSARSSIENAMHIICSTTEISLVASLVIRGATPRGEGRRLASRM